MVVKLRSRLSPWKATSTDYLPPLWIFSLFGDDYSDGLLSNPGLHTSRLGHSDNLTSSQQSQSNVVEIPIHRDGDVTSSPNTLTSDRSCWRTSLNLSETDVRELNSGKQLSDKHVYAAQSLLQAQFPDVAGLQDSCLSQTKFSAVCAGGERCAVQIHHTRGNHWVVSAAINGTVYVYDSLYSTLTDDLRKQLRDIYGPYLTNEFAQLNVIIPRVQNQYGSADCGLFAIATALELCQGRNPAAVMFDQDRMRQHLRHCFEQGTLTNFPQWPLRRRVGHDGETVDCSIHLD